MKRLLSIIVATLWLPLIAAAQSDSIRVSFVTCYPGTDVYELYGHTAIHISGRINQLPVDVALNYGLFDFNTDNFVYKFVKGETDYTVGVRPWDYFLDYYLRQNRRVVEHHIPMDSVQSARFMQLVNENLLPENCQYRYKWAHDNCSTRALDLIERTLGDTVSLPQPDGDVATDASFRQMLRRYDANYPWYQFGIDLALGSTIDRPMTAREKAFAPIAIDLQLPCATIDGRPLTDGITVINEGADATMPPTPWYLSPVFVFWMLCAAVAAVTVSDIRRRRVTRWLDCVLFALFGLAGIVVCFLTFVSVQEGTSPNWLILWLNPLCLIVPVFIWLKKYKNVVFSYQIINFALLIVLIVSWHWTGQQANPAFYPLILCDLLRTVSYLYIRHAKA